MIILVGFDYKTIDFQEKIKRFLILITNNSENNPLFQAKLSLDLNFCMSKLIAKRAPHSINLKKEACFFYVTLAPGTMESNQYCFLGFILKKHRELLEG